MVWYTIILGIYIYVIAFFYFVYGSHFQESTRTHFGPGPDSLRLPIYISGPGFYIS